MAKWSDDSFTLCRSMPLYWGVDPGPSPGHCGILCCFVQYYNNNGLFLGFASFGIFFVYFLYLFFIFRAPFLWFPPVED